LPADGDSLREKGASPHRPKGRLKCAPSPGTRNERAGTRNEGCHPERRYGVWWFNRRQWTVNPRTGKHSYKWRPKSEWVAVPIPDSGVPREWVDLARKNIQGNRKKSALGKRFWELSGGIARCDICGHTLTTQMTYNRRGKLYFYYSCRTFYEKGRDICPGRMNFRAAKLDLTFSKTAESCLPSSDTSPA
jgi:hypothetical protein